MTKLHHSYIGLGSNLDGDWGDRRSILQNAVQALAQLGSVQVSRLYSSPPMGPQDQPDYLNAVVGLETDLTALDLLDALQAIEQDAGRVRLRRWGERTLDLDLLLYDQESIMHPRLTVPHVGLFERDFVVLPLLDVLTEGYVGQQRLQDLSCLQHASSRVIADYNWHHHH